MSKLIKFNTLNMSSFLYFNSTKIKDVKKNSESHKLAAFIDWSSDPKAIVIYDRHEPRPGSYSQYLIKWMLEIIDIKRWNVFGVHAS